MPPTSSAKVGRAAACRALDLPRASLYRYLRPIEPGAPAAPRSSPTRALHPAEQQQVLEHVHSERFRDQAPPEVFATLLDEGTYLCSVRTMYRILEQTGEVRERRDQLRHPNYQKTAIAGYRPESGLELGHYQVARARKMDLLLSLRDPGHLQPATSSVGWSPHTKAPSWPSGSSRRPAARRTSSRPAHHPCRPGHLDDLQAGCLYYWLIWASPRPTAGRMSPMTTLSQKATSRIPPAFWLDPGRAGLRPGLLPLLVQHRAPSQRRRPPHARSASLRAGPRRHRPTPARPQPDLRAVPGTFCPGASPAYGRLDQFATRAGGERTGATLIYAGRCLKVVDKFCADVAHPPTVRRSTAISYSGECCRNHVCGSSIK